MTTGGVCSHMRSNYDVVVHFLVPTLKQMVKQGGGHVGHTNSLAGFLGVPLDGPYSAAKGAAMLLIDTCRVEFARYGIRFTTVYPGFVATEVTANDSMPTPFEISTEKADDHIIYALRQEKQGYLFPLSMRCLIRLARILRSQSSFGYCAKHCLISQASIIQSPQASEVGMRRPGDVVRAAVAPSACAYKRFQTTVWQNIFNAHPLSLSVVPLTVPEPL